MYERVEQVLEQVRQVLKLHAGGIELVSADAETGIVQVRLTGTCQGCALSEVTLRRGVEVALCEAIPEIRQVIAV